MKKFIFAIFIIVSSLNSSEDLKKPLLDKFIENAENKWKGNYQMIVYEVKQEMKAYLEYEKLKEIQKKIKEGDNKNGN